MKTEENKALESWSKAMKNADLRDEKFGKIDEPSDIIKLSK